jgi:hypothetical protein
MFRLDQLAHPLLHPLAEGGLIAGQDAIDGKFAGRFEARRY